MDQHENLTADQERAVAERDRLVALFGPDILTGLPTDPPAANTRPLGQRLLQDRRRTQREARQEQQKAIMRQAVAAKNKADAYARVVDNTQNRRVSSAQDLAAAADYAVEAGIVDPPSTITRLMDQSRLARTVDVPEEDDAA
jgi:hypothetical protein